MNEKESRNCPLCGGEIKLKAVKCKHCHSFIGEEHDMDKTTPDSYPPREEASPETSYPSQEAIMNYQDQGKGFFKSLFDIQMREVITPKIIRVIFVIGIIAIVFGALVAIISSIITIRATGIGVVLLTLIAAPIGALIGIIILRVYLELIMLLFNIYDQLKEITRSLNR